MRSTTCPLLRKVLRMVVGLAQSLFLDLSAAGFPVVSAAAAPRSDLDPVVADQQPGLAPQRHRHLQVSENRAEAGSIACHSTPPSSLCGALDAHSHSHATILGCCKLTVFQTRLCLLHRLGTPNRRAGSRTECPARCRFPDRLFRGRTRSHKRCTYISPILTLLPS